MARPVADDGPPVDGAESAGSGESAVRAVALRLLSRRPHTQHELAQALARRGFPREVVEAVLARFAEVGLLDDAAFAEAWVTSRHAGRGLARSALRRELRNRGVDDEAVAVGVAGVSDDEEEATARTLAARRFAALAGVPAEARYRRVAQLLARRGYPPTLIGRVLRDVAAASLDTGDGHDVESLDDGE